MDPTVLIVIGVQVFVVGVVLFALGPRLLRRWPGASSGVILGRTLGIVGGIALVVAAFYGGQTPMSTASNPNPATVTSVQTGNSLYEATCAKCHGVDGRGGGLLAGTTPVVPPSLVDHVGAHGDGDLFYWIQNGIPGGMPSFASQLTPSQTWDVINYLRTIENR
jgi:mono/diheme cytochrome c family protein